VPEAPAMSLKKEGDCKIFSLNRSYKMELIEIQNKAMTLPEYLRTTIVENGTFYLPCKIFGDEKQIGLCMAYDGIRMIAHNRHLYAPAEWLRKEYPKYQTLIDVITNSVTRFLVSEENHGK
jgi:hypothetical protein